MKSVRIFLGGKRGGKGPSREWESLLNLVLKRRRSLCGLKGEKGKAKRIRCDKPWEGNEREKDQVPFLFFWGEDRKFASKGGEKKN